MILPVSALNGSVRVAAPPAAAERPVESLPPPLGEDASGAGAAFGNGPVRGLATFPANGRTLLAAHGERDREAARDPDALSKEDEARVRELRRRDADVRRHERAHAAAAGPYGGVPVFRFQRGPDGRTYAVGGEVGIDVRSLGDLAQTIRKMEVIIRAALAPSNPSTQDRMVAAKARQIKAQAEAELQAEKEQKFDYAAKRREARVAATYGDHPSAAKLTRVHNAFHATAVLAQPAGERGSRGFQSVVG